jgi:hypothetical protein
VTVQGLYNDTDFLCGSTSITYPVATKLRNFNIHYQNVARLIWESADTWQYDDSNATDFGIATANIVASQQDYSLPSTCQRVQRVEVDGVLAESIDIHDMDLATSQEETGSPHYDLVGRSIFLYPTPSANITSGLKVFFDRDVTDLSSTSDVPGFALAFHRILSLGASIDFSRNENDRKLWVADKTRLENGLKRFYSKRGIQRKTIIKPAGKKRWRNYQ